MLLEMVNNEKILITGATGLIGQTVIKKLLKTNAKVVALVRNKEKAINIFGEENDKISYLVGDVTSLKIEKLDVDYIIHGASMTASRAFIEQPTEIIMTALEGTKNLLDIARLSNVKGFAFLSTMEVYGAPATDEKIDEKHSTNLDTMKVRSCYPESKRLCENLCSAYSSEYGVPTKVIRLTQTFGPGVVYDDGRVFAEFARCAIEKRNIVLHTKGETKRCYLATDDAADAILTILYKGGVGEAYNVANEETYCSIYEMASLVASKCADNEISVVIEETNAEKLGYAPVLHMNLDTTKLRNLGWEPTQNLEEMFKSMIESMKLLKA